MRVTDGKLIDPASWFQYIRALCVFGVLWDLGRRLTHFESGYLDG